MATAGRCWRRCPLSQFSVSSHLRLIDWGLRNYGIEPSVWGGDAGCEHEWGDTIPIGTCLHCNAWLGCLGLEPMPGLYIEHLVEIFRLVWRVMRKDGTVWLNMGDSYATGAGKVGDHPGGGKQGANWKGLATSPNRMPIPGLKPKDLCMMPARVALALQAEGWWLRQEIVWAKKNCMPESCTDRCTRSHEMVYMLTKAERYFYDQEAVREQAVRPGDISTLGSEKGRNYHPEKGDPNYRAGHEQWGRTIQSGLNGRNRRSVWTIATAPFPAAHFAVFPPALIEPMIKAGTKSGDTVLDPFSGSGTVGLVAKEHGRRAILVDAKAEYCEMAAKRVRQGVLW